MKNLINLYEVGIRIRCRREALKITQEKLASLCGLELTSIQKIEAGERGMSLQSLASMSLHLHVTTDYLLFGDEDNFMEINIPRTNLLLSSLTMTENKTVETFLSTIIKDVISLQSDKKLK